MTLYAPGTLVSAALGQGSHDAMTSASLLASAVAMLEGAVFTSVTSSRLKPTCLSRPAMYGSPPAPRVTPTFLPLSLERSPGGTPESARAITDRISLCGFFSASFHVCPISTTGTPRATAVRNGNVPNRPTSTVLLASALEISTPLGITSTLTSRPSLENRPRSTAAKNGAFSAAEVTATRSCCAEAGARATSPSTNANSGTARRDRRMASSSMGPSLWAMSNISPVSYQCYHRLQSGGANVRADDAMKKAKPRSLMREVAYERFKTQLFKRNLVPGQFVSQGELCELLDVPLGPTREALKRLEAESLVRLIPQRGIQIADIGVTLIREAFEFRTVLEVAAVRRFTASASKETIDKLERDTRGMLERMASATEPDSRMLDAALQVDWTMHDMVVEAMGNRIMTAAHRQNFDKIKMIRLHGRSPRYLPLAMEEHLAVIQAMQRRDPDEAGAAIERHLLAAERRALGL